MKSKVEVVDTTEEIYATLTKYEILFNQMCNDVTAALKATGQHVLDFHIDTQEDYPDVQVKIITTGITYQFWLREEEREVECRTIVKHTRRKQKVWVAYVIVTKSGGYWDPPYDDELEIGHGPSPTAAAVEAIMATLRDRMLNALPLNEPQLIYGEE